MDETLVAASRAAAGRTTVATPGLAEATRALGVSSGRDTRCSGIAAWTTGAAIFGATLGRSVNAVAGMGATRWVVLGCAEGAISVLGRDGGLTGLIVGCGAGATISVT